MASCASDMRCLASVERPFSTSSTSFWIGIEATSLGGLQSELRRQRIPTAVQRPVLDLKRNRQRCEQGAKRLQLRERSHLENRLGKVLALLAKLAIGVL